MGITVSESEFAEHESTTVTASIDVPASRDVNVNLTFTGTATNNLDYSASFDNEGKKGSLELCGGVCLYNSAKPIVKEFMQDWYDLYIKQNAGKWWPKGYPKSLARWDQFTLWWLVNKVEKYKDLKIGIFEDNYRWNWFAPFGFHSNGKHRLVDKHPVIIHYSCFFKKDKEY